MSRLTQRTRTIACAALAIGALVSGCSTSPVRAVADVVPEGLSYSLKTRSIERIVEPALSIDGLVDGIALMDSVGAELEEELDGLVGSEPSDELAGAQAFDLASAFGSGTTQLNPALGPVDLGWPLLIDLGAGETPHDDGIRPFDVLEPTRSGFSDSVIQASWRESLSTSSKIHATVAVTRFQDLGLIDGAGDMRFTWFVVGIKAFF